jgi:L,D-transpeptidase catalytic domain
MQRQQISKGSLHVSKSKALLRTLIMAGALTLSSISAWALKVDISISKVSQKMTVKVDGAVEYVWLVSTGGGQYDTPSGNYRIFRMEKEHFSKEWDDAPMPYSMFFTGQGHAIHGSYHIKRLGTKASHGCVRLAPQNAAILFELVQKAGYKNSTVSIKGGFFDTGPALTASNGPRKPFKWFWDKPKIPSLKATYATPAKKKKKFKRAIIIGGQEG